MMARRVDVVWLVLPLILGACSAKTTAAPTASAPSSTVPSTISTTIDTRPRSTSPTVARNAEIVGAEMDLAAARVGGINQSSYLNLLDTEDSCQACAGSDFFHQWCAASGGHIVGVSPADSAGRYFADHGPVYCYPGAKPLPELNGNGNTIFCLAPGAKSYFTVPAQRCPSGTTAPPAKNGFRPIEKGSGTMPCISQNGFVLVPDTQRCPYGYVVGTAW